MATVVSRLSRAFVDVLAPPQCALCGLPAAAPVCPLCQTLCSRPPAACPRCAAPMPRATAPCRGCLSSPPPWRFAAAAYTYAFPLDAMLGRFKYHGDHTLSPALRWLMRPLVELPWLADALVVPLPLHPRRERRRGFNQARVLAAPLVPASAGPLQPGWLSRRIDTKAQVGLAAPLRRRNLDGAFRADLAVAGRRIVLFDDVMTTGATLAAATRALLAAGARQVDCVVLARAVSAAQAGA